MPPKKISTTPLTRSELEELEALMSELKARGEEVPKPPDNKPKTDLIWPVSTAGYFSKSDGTSYNATEVQASFIHSQSRYAALIGGRGSGKSGAGSQKALAKIKAGESGAVINPDFENMRYSTWPEFRQWIPWNMVLPNRRYMSNTDWEPHKPFFIPFLNGAKVYVKGLKDPDSARGPNINWLWYDEGGRDKTGMGWKLAVASVRVGNNPQAWVTATPVGKAHWMYEFFEQKQIPQEALDAFGDDRPMVEIFYGSIKDNQNNLDPGFYASMLASYPSGWLRAQELEGKFVDPGGVLGDAGWFNGRILQSPPEVVKARVRYWDLAASEKKLVGKDKSEDPDETVGTLMSWDGQYKYIESQVAGRWAWKEIKEEIVKQAYLDGPTVPIYIEQEPGAGGKNQIAEIASIPELNSYSVRAHKPDQDKIIRANHWFSEAAKGEIFLISGLWVEGFLIQLGSFPNARHDDRIDSVSGARLCVAPIKKWVHMDFVSV